MKAALKLQGTAGMSSGWPAWAVSRTETLRVVCAAHGPVWQRGTSRKPEPLHQGVALTSKEGIPSSEQHWAAWAAQGSGARAGSTACCAARKPALLEALPWHPSQGHPPPVSPAHLWLWVLPSASPSAPHPPSHPDRSPLQPTPRPLSGSTRTIAGSPSP